jgi:hypothetical protein
VTWIYVPGASTISPSVPVEPALTSDLSWQFQILAQHCVSRGKHSPAPIWSRRWNKASWLRLLCGAMSTPSTADLGVASWMASLAASRVNPGPWPDAEGGLKTSAICGLPHDGSSSKPARGLCSLKTCLECYPRRGLTRSLARSAWSETYADLVTRLRLDSSARRKSARRMKGSGSSSSAWPGGGVKWPSPQARDGDPSGRSADPSRVGDPARHGGYNLDDWAVKHGAMWLTPDVPNGGRKLMTDCSPTGIKPDGTKVQVGLDNQVRMWPTPSAALHNDAEQPETFEARRARLQAQGINGNGAGTPLTMAVKMWPTPTANDFKGSGPTLERADGKMRGDRLDYATEQCWSTPRASDGEKGGPNQSFGAGGVPLVGQAVNWQTPRSHEVGQWQRNPKGEVFATLTGQAMKEVWATPTTAHERTHTPRKVDHGEQLANQVDRWPTPTSLSFGDSHQPGNSRSYNETMRLASSLPVPETPQDGQPSSPSAPTSRRQLNPDFVEWLMNWPPEWINCVSLGTASSPSKLRSPSQRSFEDWQHAVRMEVLRLDCSTPPPPQQLSLLG